MVLSRPTKNMLEKTEAIRATDLAVDPFGWSFVDFLVGLSAVVSWDFLPNFAVSMPKKYLRSYLDSWGLSLILFPRLDPVVGGIVVLDLSVGVV